MTASPASTTTAEAKSTSSCIVGGCPTAASGLVLGCWRCHETKSLLDQEGLGVTRTLLIE